MSPGPPDLGTLLGRLAEVLASAVDPWLLAGLLLALALVALAGWIRAARRGSVRQSRRIRRAGRGERDAESLLRALDFEIVDRQVTASWKLRIDRRHETVTCRADLLLARDGLRWVADVKTGDRAPDPRHPATRRQVLEYLLAFDVDGALVVDVEAGEVVELGFEDLLG